MPKKTGYKGKGSGKKMASVSPKKARTTNKPKIKRTRRA
jgi:hypothetical protein